MPSFKKSKGIPLFIMLTHRVGRVPVVCPTRCEGSSCEEDEPEVETAIDWSV